MLDGFRPRRRAQDAIAEIHFYGTRGYRWVLDADIEAAFDNLSHSALLERVRARVKDKRVLALDSQALARAITDPHAQAQALAALAATAAEAGDLDRAEAIAGAITDPDAQAQALTVLAAAAVQAGNPDRASLLAAGAEDLASAIADPDAQGALTQLATAAAQAGEADRARHLLALAVSSQARDIRSWTGTVVSRLFPQVIRDAGDVFLSVYKSKA